MSIGSGGGGTTGAIRPQSASAAPIWKSAPSGPAISSATNAVSVLPVVMRDQLADQVALVLRVVARRGARLPPRRLRGEPARRRLAVVHVLDRDRLRPSRRRRTCG